MNNPTQDWREEFRAANPNMSATETENNIDFIESLIEHGRLQGIEKYEKPYMELILAVGAVHPNETRHETALRYIKGAEMGSTEASEVEIDAALDKLKGE